MRSFCFICLLVIPLLSNAMATRPNIIFIYTDDQAPTAGSVFGNEELKTPNIDRIAEEGAHLKNAFVTTPVCSPARASLMTSRYGTEVGITEWINPRTEQNIGLETQWITWTKLLKQAGYQTGLVGKWHLGTADRFHPTRFGYNHFYGFRSGGTRAKNPRLEVHGKLQTVNGFTTYLLTDNALQFIKQHHNKPFLLSLHYRAPHSPWLPVPPKDWEPYSQLDPQIPNPDFPNLDLPRLKKMTREYYASMTGVDRNVGRVLNLLDELKLTKNTAVIFTSDHGYHMGHHGLWYKGNAHWLTKPLPEKKWADIPALRRPNLFDQSLRVPTAIRWPAQIKPGLTIDRVVTSLDWFPTLLAIAGVKLPAKVTIRGRNMLPLLKGKSIPWLDEFYCEYSMHSGATTHMRGYRTPQWKLMIDYQHPGRAELYHLQADPNERKNLYFSQAPQVVDARKKLTEKMQAQMQLIHDPIIQKQRRD